MLASATRGGAAADAEEELVDSSWDEDEEEEEGEDGVDTETGCSDSAAEEIGEDEADEEEDLGDGDEEDNGTAERLTISNDEEDEEEEDTGSQDDAVDVSHPPFAAAVHTTGSGQAASPFAQSTAPRPQPPTSVWCASVPAPLSAKSAFTAAPGQPSVSSVFAVATSAAQPPPAPSAFAASPLAETSAPATATSVFAFPSSSTAPHTKQPTPAPVPAAPAPSPAAQSQPQRSTPAAPTGSLHLADFDRTLGQKGTAGELRRPRGVADEAGDIRRTLARYELVFPTDKLDARIDEALYGG